jgi:[ribosomal protein S18]-alanine N-acetyltransferase
MTATYRLRDAGVADVAVLSALHAGCFEDSWSTQSMIEVMASPGVHAWIAVVNAPRSLSPTGVLPAGFAITRVAADEAELLSLGVLEAFRRKGVASALIAQAIEHVAARGAKKLFLEVAENNAAALALYTASGFTRVGRRPDYYRARDGAMTAALTLRRHVVPARWRWGRHP